MNICWHMSVWTCFHFSWARTLRVELSGHRETPCSSFWGAAGLFSKVAVPLCSPTRSVWGLQFSPSSATLMICLFDLSHSRGCRALLILHCGLDLCFPNDWWCSSSFHVHSGHLWIFMGEISDHSPVFNWFVHLGEFLLMSPTAPPARFRNPFRLSWSLGRGHPLTHCSHSQWLSGSGVEPRNVHFW